MKLFELFKNMKPVGTSEGADTGRFDELLNDFKLGLQGRRYLYDVKLGDTEAGKKIQALDTQDSAAMVMACLKKKDDYAGLIVRGLLKRNLPFTLGQIHELLRWLRSFKTINRWVQPLSGIVKACENYVSTHGIDDSLRKPLDTIISDLESGYSDAETRRLAGRLREVLGEKQGVPLNAGEAWADAVIAFIETQPATAKNAWQSLLGRCQKASGGKASGKWLQASKPSIEAIGEDTFFQKCTEWFSLVDKPRTQPATRRNRWEPDPNLVLDDSNADVLKGLVWCCVIREDPNIARALVKLALASYKKVPGIGPKAVRVGNACIFALGNMPGRSGLYQLAVLKVRVKYRSALILMNKALEEAAQREGISVEEMEEMGVPSYGLESVGHGEEELGDFTAVTNVTSFKSVDLTWHKADGKVQKSVPAAVKEHYATELKELRGAHKDIKAMLSVQKDRIEQLFLQQRNWPYAVWQERYHDHPIVGVVARNLIWRFTQGNEALLAIFHQDKFIGAAGNPLAIDAAETTVSLWHPIDSDIAEIKAWREGVENLEIVQPFKQAHREVYLLTEAEVNTQVYSNRFASHIIKQHQFNALAGARGWRYSLQGCWDGGGDEIAQITLPQFNIRAEFWVHSIGEYGTGTTDAGIFSYISTDQVRFYPLKKSLDDINEANVLDLSPMPITEVPKLVLSEILRDVDLFVGVCSVGNDPEWSDGGPEGRYRDYWHSYSFGALSASAETRKAILQNLIPKLKISKQCKLVDKFLVVEGSRRTYKIHLGSGNILMEPNNQYLCIVPDSRQKAQGDKVFLPFEGDNMLSIIISKAFLLAADNKIKDGTINSQIGW